MITKTGPLAPSFLYPIQTELQAVEELLGEEIRSDVRAVCAISGHTLFAGGKRLRPAAVLLSARAVDCAFPASTIYASAASVELIHMASLMHDDVVDGAEERRGRPTANAAFGNQVSILVGDYLLAKSIYLSAREGNLDVIRVFSNVTVGLSEGEVLQITAQGDCKTTEETYYDIIQRKTAGFIAGCCEIGAMLADADGEVVRAMASFGMNLGMAFQIADDLLDFLGDPKVTGKPRCSDLREGKMTLPLIAAYRDLREGDPTRGRLSDLITDPRALTEEEADSICALIEERDGFGYARAAAARFVDEALDCLTILPESHYRDALSTLAGYALGRNH
ncbi:MAG TPA: polyprenyl synthetase family protein [Capsulimonadaceae bacterium]|nr:polyprenyl synthetase family protein [Capsulimonadaceae bacterium]